MQIKKFKAQTLKEAARLMKSELGEDSMVLGTRVIESDPESGNVKMFELTACTDDDVSTQSNSRNRYEQNAANNSFENEINRLSQKIYANKKFDYLQKEEIEEAPPAESNPLRQNPGEKLFPQLLKKLGECEISEQNIDLILKHLNKSKHFLTNENIDRHIISCMASMIPVKDFKVNVKGKPKVVALVGPTGVGKTTTIAKLAIISKILHKLDVGLVSIDTYRLGAIDQLKIFAEVSNIDLLVAYEANDMSGILKSFKNKDIIFVDTAGRSQKNYEELKEADYFLYKGNIDETFLVLSATNNLGNLYDSAQAFQMFNYDSILFTKLDEAVSFGNLFNVAVKFNVPISFLTNGQVIPDDIIAANPEFMANMIYSGKIGK